jgi:SAM-dependent methyltransferase
MDASRLAFGGDSFDAVICIQNGISAFHVDQGALVRETLRVTRPGGKVLFSTYSDRFWDERLEWFRLQSEAGLVGEIDWEKTCNGEIVCRDGFAATTVTASGFMALTSTLGVDTVIEEVDNSSLFCMMTAR